MRSVCSTVTRTKSPLNSTLLSVIPRSSSSASTSPFKSLSKFRPCGPNANVIVKFPAFERVVDASIIYTPPTQIGRYQIAKRCRLYLPACQSLRIFRWALIFPFQFFNNPETGSLRADFQITTAAVCRACVLCASSVPTAFANTITVFIA